MSKFEDYGERFKSIAMRRERGILEITFHTKGGPLRWGHVPHSEWGEAFRQISDDPENLVVIMTGTGDEFSGPAGSPDTSVAAAPGDWEEIRLHGYRLLLGLLDIEVPVISAINGPALRHAEVPLLADIVLASDDAVFQDSAHFPSNLPPGDGMHVVMPLILGLNRGRYFLLTGQTITAQEAKEIGAVNEILSREQLLPRAWELADQLTQMTPLVLRYTRLAITEHVRRLMRDLLPYGLAIEGLASGDRAVRNPGA
jgi:enoyl-CoA hydratase/carnithine racemase